MDPFQLWFNISTWAVMLVALGVSFKSPNARWLLFCLVVVKSIDVMTLTNILELRFSYYVVISFYDFLSLMMIAFRCRTPRWAAAIVPFSRFKVISRLKASILKSADRYEFIRNEASLVLIYLLSITYNMASIYERAIRKDGLPIDVYNNFFVVKFVLSTLILMALVSVAIDGYRNIYGDHDEA